MKQKNKKAVSWSFLAPLAPSLVQLVIYSVVKVMSGRGVRRSGREYVNKTFFLLHPLIKIEITNYFNYKPRFNGVFSRNNLPRIKDGDENI